MPSINISSILRDRNRSLATAEENLETGQIWMYTPGTLYSGYSSQLGGGFCWKAPASGTAVIEAWGAGGSSARMCCCGFGLPGNSGAYSKKTIAVTAGSFVCGTTGFSCGQGDALCFRGCSDPTTLCWCTTLANGCMCAQGGKGGIAMCSTGTGPWCCFFYGSGMYGCSYNSCCSGAGGGTGCGIICNYCNGMWIGCAYGGDVNCNSIIGCSQYDQYQSICVCYFKHFVPVPAGLFSTDGSLVVHTTDSDTTQGSNWAGATQHAVMAALGALSKAPRRTRPQAYCYNNGWSCGCQEFNGCIPVLPIGMGAPATHPCGDVRDVGTRGGMGGVRIKFY